MSTDNTNQSERKFITPSIDWELKNCRVGLSDPDTREWAIFIIDNLTKKNKDVLQGVLPVLVSQFGWLNPIVSGMFGSVIEDRLTALQKAIDAGRVDSNRIPTLSYQRERDIVGAAICELLHQGYESEFLQGLKS
ncbi:hypothetical protein [Vibrio owensii]|uniref:hypothetical protein n=1 Tax=Vibrio harveyi group TaxID=717610 RepID=UPI003CC65AD3